MACAGGNRPSQGISGFLPRDAMHKRGLCRHAVSVRLSVTFVDSVKTSRPNYIVNFFSPSSGDELMTLVAGKQRSLLMAGDDDEVYDKILNVTPKTTLRSGKSDD